MGQEQFGRGNLQAKLAELGVWKSVPFNAANFRGTGSMTWTDLTVDINRFCMIGKVVLWNLFIIDGTLGGVMGNRLELTPPVRGILETCITIGTGNKTPNGLIQLISVPEANGVLDHIRIFPVPVANFTTGSFASFQFTLMYGIK